MQSFTINIPAGGANVCQTPGKVLSIKSCTLPITAAFNGTNPLPVQAGTALPFDGGFRYVNFINGNAVPVTLSFFIGDTAVAYAPADNSASNAATFGLGNLSVATGAAAANGLPQCDANGFLYITNAMALIVPGTYNGHRRQFITFSMAGNSPAPLNILDATGCAFMTILSGQQIMLPADATFTLSGAGGTAWVTVGQVFLNQ